MQLEEKLDLYTTEIQKIEENWVRDAIKKVTDLSSKKAKKMMRDSWNKLKEMVQNQGVEKEFIRIINKHLNTNLRSLSDLDRKKIGESEELNEDFTHYWQWIKDNAFPTLVIFPGLQIFFELDKIIDGDTPDFKKMIVYAIFWILVATGSHITQWDKWRKENPQSYSDEGEPSPFTIKGIKKGK